VAGVRTFVADELGRSYGTWGGEVLKEFRLGNLKEREKLDDLDTDGGIILKWIIIKYDALVFPEFICVMWWQVAGCWMTSSPCVSHK
jgi:hypothetical protein